MITTEWRKLDPALAYDPYLKEYPRRPKRIRAEYGMDAGTFGIRGVVQEKAFGRWRDTQSGQIYEAIGTHFPELEPYLKWDGFGLGQRDYFLLLEDLEKMWNWVVGGARSVEEFGWRIIFGALKDDVMPPLDTPWEEVRAWLKARAPRLEGAFRRDMRELGRMAGPEFRTGPGFEGPKHWYPGMG